MSFLTDILHLFFTFRKISDPETQGGNRNVLNFNSRIVDFIHGFYSNEFFSKIVLMYYKRA